jgi:hypothetical protein
VLSVLYFPRHGLGVLSAGRRRPAFCTPFCGRAERYLLSALITVWFSLVGLMYLVDIIIGLLVRAHDATFRALWGTLAATPSGSTTRRCLTVLSFLC